MITRALIFYEYKFKAGCLDDLIGGTTLGDISLMIFYGTEGLGVVYIIYLKVLDVN